jgi:hypothetical protein
MARRETRGSAELAFDASTTVGLARRREREAARNLKRALSELGAISMGLNACRVVSPEYEKEALLMQAEVLQAFSMAAKRYRTAHAKWVGAHRLLNEGGRG